MRYFISFLIALGLLFLVIFLLFRGGGKPAAPQLTARALAGYATSNAEAVMTIDGPVNSVQNHQQIRVTVSRDTVTYEQLQGYSGDVVNVQQYANTSDAYAAFLLSLARAGYTNGDNNPKARDERGFCPLGDRYVFQFTQDNQDLERYWTTSCGGAKTYLGPLSLTVRLFQLQVPNYSTLTQNIAANF
ncbi:MAG TPA: hypothetical protein VMU97_01015 [Candidatus Dormibacteraeota bacterium]|nr:hypothetical protein [Candidatus Dormibacteraeota bacterium]